MVESEFALTKSQNMIEDLLGRECSEFEVIVNIETKTAVNNLKEILERRNDLINGITIGRSDLSYSYGLKGQQDSDFINTEIEKIIDMASLYPDLKITVGGGNQPQDILQQLLHRKYCSKTVLHRNEKCNLKKLFYT